MSAEFLNVLNDKVMPSMDFFFPDGLGIFQDDSAKIHRALVVKEWSVRESLNWPPQSPDFTSLKVFEMCHKILQCATLFLDRQCLCYISTQSNI